MLKINPEYVEQVNAASSYDELLPLMQKAVELEHSTIPPYLTAMFSFNAETSREIRTVIHSIVIEEMLHMSISANIMNALGGSPAINKKGFVPDYPGPLPMGIGYDLIVGLEKYSPCLVERVFMNIEEPETPIIFKSTPVLAAMDLEVPVIPTFRTIGEFYQSLQEKIKELPGENLPGDPAKQVTSSFFSSELLYPIHTTDDAVNAIDIIVRQGEGTTTSPLDGKGNLAHYYEFEELFKGRKLVPNSTAPNGYSFSGDAIPFDPANVYPIFPNTKAAMLTEGTEERRRIDDFNTAYNQLLNGLHRTFNGEPSYLDNTIGLMFDVKLLGEKLCQIPFPGQEERYNLGPSFEFVDLT
jgi:hypothetical protein